MMENIFAINKPKGPTSNDVVQIIKSATGQKVGHAGTLDPLACGVLVVGVGREATKQLGEIVKKEKEYLAEIKLGQTSSTDDEEGGKEVIEIKIKPTQDQIEKILPKFIGQIKQTPPAFSAVKIKGQEAYKLARKGRPVKLEPRLVEIKAIELLEYQHPNLKLKVITGPGVYIRSLARDLGQALGTGGYLAGLVRIRVGQFGLDQAKSLDEFKKHVV